MFSAEVWLDTGKKLEECRDSLLFWVGDWLKIGLAELAEEKNVKPGAAGFRGMAGGRAHRPALTREFYNQAVQSLGFEQSTLNAAKWVASRIQPELRFYHGNTDVTWSHYTLLASLGCEYEKAPPEDIGRSANEIRMWIEWVIENKATVNELRLAIQATKAKKSKLIASSSTGEQTPAASAAGATQREATESDDDVADAATGGQCSNIELVQKALRALRAVNNWYNSRMAEPLTPRERELLQKDYEPLATEMLAGADIYEKLA
jgi:hypothetical protein